METQGEGAHTHSEEHRPASSSLDALRSRVATSGNLADSALDAVYQAIFLKFPSPTTGLDKQATSLKEHYMEIERKLLECNALLRAKSDIQSVRLQGGMEDTADVIEQERARTWKRELESNVASLLGIPHHEYEQAIATLGVDPVEFSKDALIAYKKRIAQRMGSIDIQMKYGEAMPSNQWIIETLNNRIKTKEVDLKTWEQQLTQRSGERIAGIVSEEMMEHENRYIEAVKESRKLRREINAMEEYRDSLQ